MFILLILLNTCLSFYQEVTRAHKGWALDSVVLQNQITRYNKEDIHDQPAEGKSAEIISGRNSNTKNILEFPQAFMSPGFSLKVILA